MGIPFELITFLGSTVLGAVTKIWGMKTKAKAQKDLATLEALNAKAKVTKEAREYQDKGFQWTRRFIAISSIAAIVVVPIVAGSLIVLSPFTLPDLTITLGYTELQGGLWPFTETKTVVKWYTSENGILIAPFHTHLVSAITGMYFGSSGAGSKS